MPGPVHSIPGVSRNRVAIEQQLTLKEVAEVTGTSVPTVRRWISAGQLRAYYFGKRALRIDPADLRAMRREVNPATYAVVNGGDAA